ncbi:hypothetical protein [Actinoplanes sp. NPDC049265]|uniref:hypothetical protein n=1 Tax=Actinoplanes sp. NPDC049265 TaxID=3363902 RepID=UPI003714DDDD
MESGRVVAGAALTELSLRSRPIRPLRSRPLRKTARPVLVIRSVFAARRGRTLIGKARQPAGRAPRFLQPISPYAQSPTRSTVARHTVATHAAARSTTARHTAAARTATRSTAARHTAATRSTAARQTAADPAQPRGRAGPRGVLPTRS